MNLSDPIGFPVRPDNRPALGRIGYRIGAYPDILDAMLRRLNATPELSKWTHRAPDDPGIALIESAAVVADILTFYQEHYANELFLRTAQWRESVQELVRLTGYRLSPGLGGRATIAFEVKAGGPVVVPAGFPVKAELEAAKDPVEFETEAEFTAHPHLGRFHLYRQRHASASLSAASRRFEIQAVGGATDPDSLAAFDLKKGDRLMLVPAAPGWLVSGGSVTAQKAAQVVKVESVRRLLGRLEVEIEGRIQEFWPGPVTAYRIQRTFRHFGHNTPAMTTLQSGSGTGMVTVQTAAHVLRHVGGAVDQPCYGSPRSLYTDLPRNILPLDQEVNDLSLGGRVIAELVINPGSGSDPDEFRRVVLVCPILGLRATTMSWGNVSGPSTWIRFSSDSLISNPAFTSGRVDIRQCRIHEVTSPALTLRGPTYHWGGALTNPDELFYYGTRAEAEPLAGRAIHLASVSDPGRFASVTVQEVDLTAPAHARMRRVTLQAAPKGFQRVEFDEADPQVVVLGNLVEATQGKAEPGVALGNGDARQTFQTFKLPKAPLTYLLDPGVSPPHVPELAVEVGGRVWTRVEALFGRGPTDEVYIVREDAEGESYVQFGDGETGARLPSGIQNVVARFRVGSGALGPVKAGTKPSAGARLERLDKVTVAGEVTGGAPPEDGGKARLSAPGRIQALGRLVSLQDYETETLQLNGVVATAAAWEAVEGVPSVRLAVLLEAAQQSDAQFTAVEAVIRAADRERGPLRHPLRVVQCELRYLYLALTYAADPALVAGTVENGIRATLGLADDAAQERIGLLGVRRRRLGEREYASRIEGVVQGVPGVVWCRVDHLGLLAPANDPETLVFPAAPTRAEQLACAPTELLQLHSLHLRLTPVNP